MSGDGQAIWWRVIDGGLPGCPLGTTVSFVTEGQMARVMMAGVGQVGTLRASTTKQTSTQDGITITLDNPTEGWRAILTRTAAPTAQPGTPFAVTPTIAATPITTGEGAGRGRLAIAIIVVIVVLAAIGSVAGAGAGKPSPSSSPIPGVSASPATAAPSTSPAISAGT